MHTVCPQCKTTFSVTEEQLEERDGVVRCGKCTIVFQAGNYLVEKSGPTSSGEKPETSETEKPHPKEDLEEIFYQLVGRRPRSLVQPVVWLSGCILLMGMLFVQYVYFYRDQLAKHPEYGNRVIAACDRFAHLGCRIIPPREIGRIELTHTTVKPHPKYEKMLRVKATLVNRANFPQAYPLMEISLSNRLGEVTSRRIFNAEQFLTKKELANKFMPKNVAIGALLDITNLNSKTQGYEIRLVAWD